MFSLTFFFFVFFFTLGDIEFLHL